MENEEKKELEPTNSPDASPAEQKPDASKLDETSLKTTEELEQELAKAKETLQKAEHTIVSLKKQKASIDVETIKSDIFGEVKKEIEPKLKELSDLEKLKKEIEELKASLLSKSSQANLGEGKSVVTETNKPTPSVKDIEIANKFFGGDIDRYIKNKVNSLIN